MKRFGLNRKLEMVFFMLFVDGSPSFFMTVLTVDEGNGAEGHGTWGILDGAQAGGYVQIFLNSSDPDAQARVRAGSDAACNGLDLRRPHS